MFNGSCPHCLTARNIIDVLLFMLSEHNISTEYCQHMIFHNLIKYNNKNRQDQGFNQADRKVKHQSSVKIHTNL